MNSRKNDSADIGDNTTAVVLVGLTVGLPLLFLGWLLKQVVNVPGEPVLTSLTVAESTRRLAITRQIKN